MAARYTLLLLFLAVGSVHLVAQAATISEPTATPTPEPAPARVPAGALTSCHFTVIASASEAISYPHQGDCFVAGAPRNDKSLGQPVPTPTLTWEEWASGILGIATNTATTTARVNSPRPKITSNILERLIEGKPGPWGSKGFYLLLAILYVGLLGMLVKFAVDLLRTRSRG